MQKVVGEIFSRGLVAVPPELEAGEAVALMRDRRISCVVVVDDGRAQGIFTERDVVRLVAGRGNEFLHEPIVEVMSPGAVQVRPQATIHEAFALLLERHIRHLVVAEAGGPPLGVLTQSDLVDQLGYEFFIKVQTVAQIMSRAVLVVDGSTPLRRASQILAERQVSFLVVGEACGGPPLGVLTERDVARLALEAADLEIPVAGVMSSPVATLHQDSPAYAAAEMMRERHIRRVVVVDECGRLAGVVTQSDLVRGLESKYIETLKQIIRDQGLELERTSRELSEKTLYLDNLLSTAMDMGIVATDTEFNVVYHSASAGRILGSRSSDVLGKRLDRVHEGIALDAERFARAMEEVRHHGSHEFCFTRRQGGVARHVNARVSAVRGQGGLVGYVLMVQDVTEKRQAEETIRFLAYHDTLTGLANRVLFAERLDMDLARCRRHGLFLALVVLDLDRFKEVNDHLGHHAGDQVLHDVAHRLQGLLRQTDTVARMGGDEFTVILPDLKAPEDALAAAEKLLQAFARPVLVEDTPVEVRASMGVAVYPGHGEDGENLLRHADRAMYRAKRLGRDNHLANIVLEA